MKNLKPYIVFLLLGVLLLNHFICFANSPYEKNIKHEETFYAFLMERYEKAEYYYKNNALFLAAEELRFLDQESYKFANDSVQMLVGQTYQLLNHIYYDIGYMIEIKETADSMYYYKSLASNGDPQYKVEYLSYLSRFHAAEMKTKNSYEDMLEALEILRELKNTNGIDINFFYFNYLNTARNYKNLLLIEKPLFEPPENDSSKVCMKKLISTADSLINTLKFEEEKWYHVVFYFRVRNNLYQDLNMVYGRTFNKENVANHSFNRQFLQSQLFFERYKPNAGVPQFQMLAVKGLQHTYYQEYSTACQYYEGALKGLSIDIDGIKEYRSVMTPMMVLLWYSNAYLHSQNGNNLEVLDSILNQSLAMERVYNQYLIHYVKPETEYISTGYRKAPYIQMITLSYHLYSITKNKNYLNIYWHYANKARYTSLYYKLIEERDGIALEKFQLVLDSINTAKFILLDQLYLSRKNVESFDTFGIKRELKINNQKYEEVIHSKSSALQALYGNRSFISIDAYASKLKQDEAALFYTSHSFQTKYQNYVMLLKKDSSEIIHLGTDTLNVSKISYLNEKILNNPEKFQYLSYYISERYFKPIVKKLEGIQKIKIIPSFKLDYLPFDILIKDTLQHPHYKDFQYYGMDYNFEYLPNVYVEQLLKNRIYHVHDSILIFSPDYRSQNIKNTLPFNHRLGNELKSKRKSLFIQNFNDLNKLKEHSTFKYVHIAAHGIVDYDYKYIVASYNTRNSYNIYLSDSTISKKFFQRKKINTDLSVVASCRAGFSTYDFSDGKIGMIRSLYLSGSNAIITTPWRLDDQSSAQILADFYERIESGEPYSEALWNAKKDFLAHAKDPQLFNPIYWAALSYHGVDSKIEQPGLKKSGIGIIVILFGGVLIYWLFRIKRD